MMGSEKSNYIKHIKTSREFYSRLKKQNYDALTTRKNKKTEMFAKFKILRFKRNHQFNKKKKLNIMYSRFNKTADRIKDKENKIIKV